jgi:hypothetical protein
MRLTPAQDNGLRHGFDKGAINALRSRIEAKHQELARVPAAMGQVPLHIACHASDCGNGLHCLNYARKGKAGAARGGTSFNPGECRACQEAIGDMPTGRAISLDEVASLFDMQRRELIREHYWKAPLDQWAFNQASRLGRTQLHSKARKLIRQRIGSAQHPVEGRQTGWSHDIVAYAQHAVAACCRECVFYWHGIAMGRPLAEVELTYLTGLATVYLDLRLPDLPDEPSNPGTIRKSSLPPTGDPFDLRQALGLLLSQGESPAGMTVPDSLFTLLKTDVVVDGGVGSVSMRPVAQQMTLGADEAAEAG